MSDDQQDDTVGYKKPPRHSRFKPQQSGNPKGRPKGSKNMSTLIKGELDAPIAISEGGKTRRVSKREALVKTQVAKALKGDHKAAHLLMGLDMTIEVQEKESRQIEQISTDDEAIVATFLSRFQPPVLISPLPESNQEEQPTEENPHDQ